MLFPTARLVVFVCCLWVPGGAGSAGICGRRETPAGRGWKGAGCGQCRDNLRESIGTEHRSLRPWDRASPAGKSFQHVWGSAQGCLSQTLTLTLILTLIP